MQKNKEHIKSLISELSVDNRENPLFFGKPLGMQRFDTTKYKQIEKFYDDSFLLLWREHEFNLTKDKEDFRKLTENEQRIFTQNLGYQILLDSVQSRGINNLLEHCTNAELEAGLGIWAMVEGIHSKSYTHIIRNVYTDPTEVLDKLSTDEKILARAHGVTKYYDDLINSLSDEDDYSRKKKLYLTLVSIQILEAVRFYVSFACSYYFAERGVMTGNAKIIQKINIDENCFSGDTEILTSTGWKMFKDLDETELVGQYDKGVLSFVKPLAYTNKEYSGDMIKISNQSHECLVTPDHDILLFREDKGWFKEKAGDVKFSSTKKIPHFANVTDDGESNLTNLDRLKIALQADGYNLYGNVKLDGTKNKRGNLGGYTHGIYVKKESKVKRIEELLNSIPDLKYTKVNPSNGKTGYIYSLRIDNYDCKQLNFLYDLELNYKTCVDIIDEVSKWDSHIRSESAFMYCSTDKKCIDIIQDIAIRCGYESHITVSEDDRKETYKTYYRLSLHHRTKLVNTYSLKKETIQYDGNVYCVTVPSGNIITRRNNKTFIAGNCHVGFTNFLIKTLRKNESEGFQEVIKDCEPLVAQMWRDASEEEIAWAEYLFEDGDLVGLNADILKQYMHFLCNLRMRACGYERIFPVTKNPILWIQKYVDSSAVQNAPQESENTAYLTNSVTSENMDFSGDEFEL
ncbi:ribonucleoside diphosphate reductase small subunit [Tenacibaculum phage PTm1]|uniref:ribonucleoside-diphosphate reductase n=2 Tax=Shirahamavirus PTm1 TaxID=2846435 RepID=A0A5S9HXG0_9CAUD|nr:ribonucleoside diphosphate reductase small subunit [Tenacibaculum phage PTm1]BBI90448.1 ribonucleotide-diphosphate reductase subunit beta [Tenacibaculum phage PTm1]BBI90756.1 ribonucleotide-diphosphate reductase subunit beta [Tenacibaculum phage PTm5]